MEAFNAGMPIERSWKIGDSVTIPAVASIANCVPIINGSGASMLLHITGSSPGTLTFYGCSTYAGTYVQIYGSPTLGADPVAATLTNVVTNSLVEVPSACFASPWLKVGATVSCTAVPVSKG